MILVVGGAGSGKEQYVRGLCYDDAAIADGVIDDKPVLINLHRIVFADPSSADNIYDALVNKEAVTCNEVGSGIIPLDRHERAARDACGRLCCRLAKSADKVVRMVCGIPIVIKGANNSHVDL